VVDPAPVVLGDVEAAPANAIVVRPDGLRTGAVVVSSNAFGCCGLDGMDGPNQSCAACGQVLGTAWTDCYQAQEVRLSPDAVWVIN
jgi:hypothetical protein